MSIWKNFTNLLKNNKAAATQEIKFKISREYLSLNPEEKNKFLAKAFCVDYCIKSGLTKFKITPPKNYFKPINELISFKDEEEFYKFLNLV